MTLEELLKGQNLTDEQVTAIIDGMKENKIFTASEENLDIRYGKLKTDHDALAVKDAESQKLIEELQKATKGQDAVQAKITEYVVVSNKVESHKEWYKIDSAGKEVVESGGDGSTKFNLSDVIKSLPFAKVGDKVTKVTTEAFFNPIIKLNNDAETEDDMPAITYFLKRGNLVEHDREPGVADDIVCTAYGMPALTNDEKVVILKVKA